MHSYIQIWDQSCTSLVQHNIIEVTIALTNLTTQPCLFHREKLACHFYHVFGSGDLRDSIKMQLDNNVDLFYLVEI
jgi:hypothetical protein